jgi:ubiquinol-cytochrome c reductase cytochrome b subunit
MAEEPRETPGKVLAAPLRWAEDRIHFSAGLHGQLNKVFPERWSFMLGEIALYSFVVLLVSGTYLALFFDPSMTEVTYHGDYTAADGSTMSRAFASTLDLSFDVRGGLLMRQVHHWAALVFVAAIIVHMLRIFFSGAFRRPREANWVIGTLMFVLAIAEGFAGYSLPDDLLSGTGLRIASGIMQSIPLVGTWIHWLVFGGEFPGTQIIPRLFTVHVLLLPGILVALVTVHLGLVWRQKHTQSRGPKQTERNVVGTRIVPGFAAKSIGLFVAVGAVLTLMGGLFQINPIWNYGPYDPIAGSAGSQPDWYIAWVDGAARIWPAWEITLGGHRIPAPFWPTVVMPVTVIGVLALYPWIERRLTGDRAHHNLIDRARDVPVRSGLGAMALTFFVLLLASGFNDIIALTFGLDLDVEVWVARIAIMVLPPLVYVLTYRVCRGLQTRDHKVLAEGIETGIVVRRPDGQFVEIHQPLGSVREDGEREEIRYAGAPVPRRMNQLGLAGRGMPGSLLRPDPQEETDALDEARAREAGR